MGLSLKKFGRGCVLCLFQSRSEMAINAVGAAGRICVLDLDLQGVRSLKKSEISPYYIFIQPASFEDLEMRLRERYAPWHVAHVVGGVYS